MSKALIPVAFESQDEEVIYPYYRLQEAGFDVDLCHIGSKPAIGKHGIKFPVNKIGVNINDIYDLIIIPGGWGAEILRSDLDLLSVIKLHHENNKFIGAICHGPWVLISAGIIKDKIITCYPGMLDDVINAGGIYNTASFVVDHNIITAPHYRNNPEFMREILDHVST
jgi:protease I